MVPSPLREALEKCMKAEDPEVRQVAVSVASDLGVLPLSD